jgi:hypothetical protein
MTRAFPPLPAFFAALALTGCMRDGGYVAPDDDRNLTVLARFQGEAVIKNTTLSGERMGNITNPKVALVWQFVGPSAYGVAFDNITVDTRSPFRFMAEFRNPPPDSIAFSEEPVIGTFWFYSDGNENGVLDRIAHPKVMAHDAELAGLQGLYKSTLQSLLDVSDIRPKGETYKDTFLVDSIGTFIHLVGGRKEVLFQSGGRAQKDVWNEVLFRRLRLLRNYNGWQNFFALRKKLNEFYRVMTPTAEYSWFQEFEERRILFPKAGMDAEFEYRLQMAGWAYMKYILTVQEVQQEAADSGWADYPFQGFEHPGTDWVVGKSRKHFVLYFPNRVSLDRVLQAEATGSFSVDGIDGLHLGYNLIECDDQYRCKVLGKDDKIYVELADNEVFFNPPSSELKSPITAFTPVPLPSDSLKFLAGHYQYKPNRPILILSRGGSLWCDVPDLGIFRMHATGGRLFYVPGTDLQFEFIATVGGRIGKLLMYHLGERGVGYRTDSLVSDEAMERKIDRIQSRVSARWPASLLPSLPGLFMLGKDSMRLAYDAEGKGLSLGYLGFPAAEYVPANDSEAFQPGSDAKFTFVRNEAGTVTGLRWSRFEGTYFLPNPDYKPRGPAAFFPDPGTALTSPASEHGGSGQDSYVKLGGGRRYACAEDGRYLKAGDGWLEAIRKGASGDSISLRDPDDGVLFRVTGQAGKRIRLDLIACGEKSGRQGRVLMALHGGESAQGPFTKTLSEADWVRPGPDGDTVSFSPIPIPSDPYFLDLRKVHTWDDSLYFSFDGYRAWSD